MAETIVGNQVCRRCGVEVRNGALFCYNCGSDVASEIAIVKNDKIESVDNTPIQKISPAENKNVTEFKQSEIKVKQKVKEIVVEETVSKPMGNVSSDEETKLKPAAAMRRKPKAVQPKKIEVVWEEHENAPNVWFILVAIFLTIVAAVILFLAMRLR